MKQYVESDRTMKARNHLKKGEKSKNRKLNLTRKLVTTVMLFCFCAFTNEAISMTQDGNTPINDQCSNAINLSFGTTVSGTLAGANSTTSTKYGNNTDGKKDVFFKFTPDHTGNYKITMNNSNNSDDIDLMVLQNCENTNILATLTSSEYIINSFSKGMTYIIRVIDWSGTGGDFTIKIESLNQEDDFIQESKHFRLEIYKPLLSITTEQLADWLSCLDRMYEQYVDLMSGLTPFEGEKIVIRNVWGIGAWAYAGNPIQWNPAYISETFTKFVNTGDWSFGILHEMGHCFRLVGTENRAYDFNEELFANFRMYLALTKVPEGKIIHHDGRDIYYGAEIADYYKPDYDRIVADKSPLNGDGLLWTLARLGDHYQKDGDHGYWLYKQAFYIINNSPNEELSCNWNKFNYFLDILSSCVGRNVKEIYSTEELNLIELALRGNQPPWQIGYPNTSNIIATLDNGTLSINGTGAIQDWGWGEFPSSCFRDDITNIIINDGITEIGLNTFIQCTNLVSVNIGKNVNNIKKGAFSQCFATKEIHCNNPIPPSIENNDDFFWGLNRITCTLYVPYGSIDAYKSAYGWKNFFNIYTSIDQIDTTNFNVYPNPVKNELTVERDNLNMGKEIVQVIDFSGRIVIISQFEPSISQLQIDVSHLQSGIYLLKIGNYRSKFIKE